MHPLATTSTPNPDVAPTALVLGARGAVGRTVVAELRRLGVDVTAAGRSVPEPQGLAIDLRTTGGFDTLRGVASGFDAVINTTGIEDPRLLRAAPSTILVDISATAAYLDRCTAEFARQEPGTFGPHGLVLGVGIAPGLSTLLVEAIDSTPGDEIDVAIMLGGGEAHGPAAVEWTAGLAGTPVFEPGDPQPVMNFRESLHVDEPGGSRRYLRADFPDQLLAGTPRELLVRSWLATDSRLSTAALGLVGRFPALRPLVARAPHLGSTAWSITAINRRTGHALRADGDGQSRTTGVLTAHATLAAVDRRIRGSATTASLMSLAEVDGLAGLRITETGTATKSATDPAVTLDA